MKRAILYARVSTDDQAEKGYSLPSQIEACRKYAERLGFSVVLEIKEDHSGAIAIAERPEGKKVVTLLHARQADVVIAYQVDRLSRDIVDLLASVRVWIRQGIEVHACDIGKIESELDIVLVIKGWQGSDERKRIVERSTRGRNSKARSGKVVGNGWVPFGYRYSNGALDIVESDAKIVGQIYRWYIYGEQTDPPISAFAIALKLSKMGIPTPSERQGHCRTKLRKRARGVWNSTSILRMISNETYKGIYRYGKSIGFGGKGGKRLPSEQISVSVPAIIDEDTWGMAQAQRERNSILAFRNCKAEYLLRGLVKCQCGSSMVAKTLNSGTRYYRCVLPTNRHASVETVGCNAKTVRADRLETLAWEYILELWGNKERFERILREAQENLENLSLPLLERQEAILGLITECEDEAQKLAEAAKHTPKDGIVWRAVQAQVEEVERRYSSLTKERDELRLSLENQVITDEDISRALKYREDVEEGLSNPDYQSKRRHLELLGVSIVVSGGKAEISSLIPRSTRTFEIHSLTSM